MIPSEKSVKYVMSAHRNMPLSLNMSVMRSMKLGREGLAWRNHMGSWDAVVSRTVWFWKILLLSDFTEIFLWNCGLILCSCIRYNSFILAYLKAASSGNSHLFTAASASK